jgi:hypothetical protein
MAHNLGRLMRELFGMGTPRGLQKAAAALAALLCTMQLTLIAIWRVLALSWSTTSQFQRGPAVIRLVRRPAADWRRDDRKSSFSTGC